MDSAHPNSSPVGNIFQGAYCLHMKDMKSKIYFPSFLTLIFSYTFKL